jgi:spermidine synthase
VGTGLAALAHSLARGDRGHRARGTAALVAAVAIALLFAPGPTAAWRHAPIGTGRVSPELLGSPNAIEGFLRESRRKIVWEADGVESSVALDASSGLAFVLNGKIDGHARMDAGTQIMSGLLGAILHGSARNAMVIGLGTGSTAGWLAHVPSIENVDVVELEPAIAHVARACNAVNEGALDDPKVHVSFGDAREWLVVRRAEYDLVFSEPSNPYRAGIASLFTEEYYRAVLSHLSPSGIFLQWVQAYEVDARTVRAIMATLASVFPAVETWQSKYQDLLFVASRAPIAKDARLLRTRISEEPYARALGAAWGVRDLEGVLAHHLARPSLARAIAGVVPEIATDDANLIEFGFARAVGQKGGFDAATLARVARARGEATPEIAGEVDWARVEYARRIVAAMEPAPPFDNPLTPEDQASADVLARWADGDDAGALAAWRSRQFVPRGPFELAVAADIAARGRAPDARRLVDALRTWSPVSADGLLALTLAREGKPAEAATALEASLVGYRADPWPYAPVMAHVIAEAPSIAATSPDVAARILSALALPFAVRMLDADRLAARLRIVSRGPATAWCSDAIDALEPNFPWELHALELRLACYAKAADPRAEAAARELVRFREGATFPFGEGL